MRFTALLLAGAVGAAPCATPSRAVELKLLTAGAFKSTVQALLPEYEKASGNKVSVENDTVGALMKRIEAGEKFDVVVMTQALQAVHYPDKILDEMLRVGRQCIITFPNFGHWRCRWYLASKGRMPVSEFLPYTWYNTPNIHFCTFEDFEELCRERDAKVIDRLAVDQQHRHGWASKLWPNLLGEIGIYRVSSPGLQDHKIAV